MLFSSGIKLLNSEPSDLIVIIMNEKWGLSQNAGNKSPHIFYSFNKRWIKNEKKFFPENPSRIP